MRTVKNNGTFKFKFLMSFGVLLFKIAKKIKYEKSQTPTTFTSVTKMTKNVNF